MKRRLAIPLVAQAFMLWSAIAGGEVILRASVTPETAWVGQRVLLQIDVLDNSGWAQITRFGEVELSGAYLVRSDSQGTRLQETIDGVSYSGQRYELSIYPQVAGAIEVPAILVEIATKVWDASATERVQRDKTPRVTISSKLPPGAENVRSLISTSRLTATQAWEPTIDAPKVGDALERSVTMQAENVSGMAFFPLAHREIAGVGVYPAEPSVQDSADRGTLTGKRVEHVTYVLEQAGETQLPDVELTWWNLTDETLEHVVLPGLRLNVTRAPAGPSGTIGPSDDTQLSFRNYWLPAILVVAFGFLFLRFRKRIARRWSLWRTDRKKSETRVFRIAIRSIGTGKTHAALRDLMRWIDRINQGERPARLDVFLRRYGDDRTREIVDHGLRNLESDRRISDPSTLITGLSAARDRWRGDRKSKKLAQNPLPALNPAIEDSGCLVSGSSSQLESKRSFTQAL